MARYVIIGAGPAGMRAAETLRAGAAEAEIILIGDEPHLPYDRPPLSKAYLSEGKAAAQLYLKPDSFYAEQRITVKLGSPATAIERTAKEVRLASGERVAYDRLLLATGCRVRRLPAQFETVPILYLRNIADAEAIRAALRPGLAIVMIGGGFIGLEIAASAVKLGATVTVLEGASRVMSRGVPPVISDFVHRLHESHGVRFITNAKLERFAAGAAGGVIVTGSGIDYPGDLVIAGIGAAPNSELAEAAGLAVEDGILVDEFGRTNDPDIFAAGDVTRHRNPLLGHPIRVESWQVALNQAAAVARAMLGGAEPYAELPWLWTDQYECNIQLLGLFTPALEMLQRGDAAGGAFTLLGLDGAGRIAAAVTVNNGRDMAVLRRLVAAKAVLPREQLGDPARKLTDLLKAARGG
jgi:anthranilate 1,2-dioxygenase ferredoxin reductase component